MYLVDFIKINHLQIVKWDKKSLHYEFNVIKKKQ